MKGGKTPIHLWGRWCPSDFLEDETVKLVAARGDTVSLSVYFMALQASHRAGGDLPADREELAALLGMPRRVVERGLAIWLERGKLVEDQGRLFHRRVQTEVTTELEFRESQADSGRKGGLARASRLAQGEPKASLPGASSEPQARRTPYARRQTPDRTDGDRPANPLIAGRRPDIEREGYRLIREIHALEPERDQTEILLEAARWEGKDGRARTKCRLETMTDDHLIRTVHDLRTILDAAKEERGAKARASERQS